MSIRRRSKWSCIEDIEEFVNEKSIADKYKASASAIALVTDDEATLYSGLGVKHVFELKKFCDFVEHIDYEASRLDEGGL